MNTYARVVALLAVFTLGGAMIVGTATLLLPQSTPATRPSAVGGPFKLSDQYGHPVTDADYKGKPFLVFFGFTNCPDICPTTLFDMSETFKRMGSDADKISALFISVDPERDTPEKLKDYLSNFHPRIVGLTGSPEEVAAVEKAYRVYAKKVPLDGGGYTMDHSAIVYLMDKNGNFVAPFNLKQTADAAAADLKKYL